MARKAADPNLQRVLLPRDLQRRYGLSQPSRWRWERDGRIPPRDVFIAGKPAGWYQATIEAAERNAEPVKASA